MLHKLYNAIIIIRQSLIFFFFWSSKHHLTIWKGVKDNKNTQRRAGRALITVITTVIKSLRWEGNGGKKGVDREFPGG